MAGGDYPLHPYRDRDINPAKYEIEKLVRQAVRQALRERGDKSLVAAPGAGGGGMPAGGDDNPLVAGTVFVTVDDTTADVLDNTLTAGTGLKKIVVDPAGDETLELGVEVDAGGAFPVAPEDWQLFYRTDEGLLYVYDAVAVGWVAVAGAAVDPGANAGEMLYWDGAKWTPATFGYLQWVEANKSLRVGDDGAANVLVSSYVRQMHGNASIVGIIGDLDRGGLALLEFLHTEAGVTHMLHDCAADVAKLAVDTQAVNARLSIINSACRFNLTDILESGAGSQIDYNIPGGEAFAVRDLLQVNGAGYNPMYDRNVRGATRNGWCGENGAVYAGALPVSDSWGVSFPFNLPDVFYSIQVFVRAAVVPTRPPLAPAVPTLLICGTAHQGQTGSKGVGLCGGGVTWKVYNPLTGLGLETVAGYATSDFCNWNALVAAVPIAPPYNTLAGAGLNVCEWILRRYF